MPACSPVELRRHGRLNNGWYHGYRWDDHNSRNDGNSWYRNGRNDRADAGRTGRR
jgi:hypothetical protein